eukprot:TRINITY_DN1143_c0_g1_i1.p2 TRINITY_DN1143_c0_g1~~TRINITY_DN1143_c0_g1_i1.p2  ORF type:complete len:475 (+),score=145.22 TRINITY_DN1143_c0_g1_i1:61-1485(+)
MDVQKSQEFVENFWEKNALAVLGDYVKIPNVSPLFDPKWKENGLLDQAAQLLFDWVQKQGVKGLESEIVRLPERTPVIFITIKPTNETFKETILMYGHLDKQPPLTESWDKGLHPYQPTIRDGKLYGRGSSDDGYSTFAAVGAVKALQEQGIAHGRIVIIIEAAEESGSPDLPHYVTHLEKRIGVPTLIVCLDSGCATYDQLWLTTSLRGLAVGNLRVDVLKEACHSGQASGVVPSSFRIIRQLLSRVEDENTGKVLIPEFFCEIPENRLKETRLMADAMKNRVYEDYVFVPGTKPMSEDPYEATLNRCWRPTVSYTGIEGVPALSSAGNVVRTYTTLKLSMRVPPRGDSHKAAEALKKTIEKDPPYGAKVSLEVEKCADGWDSPKLDDWLEKAINKASTTFFKKPANFQGEGGSIPFMGMLGQKFPKAQFVITGVLGPGSNAHGPNEFLMIDTVKKVTACVSSIIADHHEQFK